MTRILFVCHGNICRSPMAEFVCKELVRRAGQEASFEIRSAATSTEEIGRDIHPGTKRKLSAMGIPFTKRQAVQVRPSDYTRYDHLIVMDHHNLTNLRRIFPQDPDHKIRLLLSYTGQDRDIADPWYTGDFDATYADILAGCTALLQTLSLAD